jgi:hypothetical protein
MEIPDEGISTGSNVLVDSLQKVQAWTRRKNGTYSWVIGAQISAETTCCRRWKQTSSLICLREAGLGDAGICIGAGTSRFAIVVGLGMPKGYHSA